MNPSKVKDYTYNDFNGKLILLVICFQLYILYWLNSYPTMLEVFANLIRLSGLFVS